MVQPYTKSTICVPFLVDRRRMHALSRVSNVLSYVVVLRIFDTPRNMVPTDNATHPRNSGRLTVGVKYTKQQL